MTNNTKTTKTNNTKTTKTATRKTATKPNETLQSAIAKTFFVERFESATEKLALLQSATERDATEIRKYENIVKRSGMFASLLENDAFAAAWDAFDLQAAQVGAMQIYAQDKMAATLRAVAANTSLSNVRAGNHSNNMTQRLVHVLKQHGSVTVADAPRFMHDAFSDKSMGTYSAQATSSRQVLDALGMLSWDVLTKAFSLNERAAEYDHVISS